MQRCLRMQEKSGPTNTCKQHLRLTCKNKTPWVRFKVREFNISPTAIISYPFLLIYFVIKQKRLLGTLNFSLFVIAFKDHLENLVKL